MQLATTQSLRLKEPTSDRSARTEKWEEEQGINPACG
jgi:hypothetical protein